MSLYFNRFFSKYYLINFLFAFIPISFIAGNLILNLNIILLLFFGIFFYWKDIIKIKIIFVDKLILVFFSYALVIGFTNNFHNFYVENSSESFRIIIKTISYFRFLLLYFIIRYLVTENIINFKTFFISCSLSTLFVCLDLIYQLIFGKDIFGYSPVSSRTLSGPFGDEPIAGAFLQRFSLFLFFLFPIFFKMENKNILKLILTISFVIIIFGAIIAGNRMPFVLLIFAMILVLFFEKSSRKYLIPLISVFLIVFTITFKFNSNVYVHFQNFYEKTERITNTFINGFSDFKNPVFNSHYKEFYTGYITWKQNKFFGGGIKSFRTNCSKKLVNCGNHPHNYYLEILSDLGLFGLLILSIIFIKILYDSFIKKYFSKSALRYNHVITPFMFLFFVEIFPIKTTGSFFTTANATYFFLVMAVTIALSKKKI